MGPSELRTFCHLEPAAEKMVQAAIHQLPLSTHAFHHALKVARTSVDRNMVYADGAIKLAKPLVSPLAISYTLLEKRE